MDQSSIFITAIYSIGWSWGSQPGWPSGWTTPGTSTTSSERTDVWKPWRMRGSPDANVDGKVRK